MWLDYDRLVLLCNTVLSIRKSSMMYFQEFVLEYIQDEQDAELLHGGYDHIKEVIIR